MKTPKNLISFVEKPLLLISLLVTANAVALENQFNYIEGQLELQTSGSYFKTDGNYKSGGSKESLPSDFAYQLIDFNVRSRFVFLQNWAFYGSINIGTSESKDTLKTLTNSTLNWISFGTDYLWLDGDFKLISDFELVIPFEKVASDMDTSLNWDGAIHARPRLFLEYDFNTLKPYVYGGIEWRDKGLSTLAIYGGGMRLDFGSFQFGGELSGYTSIKDDQYTNETFQREGIISSFNGNSKKFYSVNPSLVDSDLFVKYSFSKNWLAQLNAGLTLSGSESAAGYHALALVKYSFDTGSSHSSHRSEFENEVQRSTLETKERKQFQEDVEDGVDQKYFVPAPAVKERPVAPTHDSSSSFGDSGDYQIELKKNRKSKKKK